MNDAPYWDVFIIIFELCFVKKIKNKINKCIPSKDTVQQHCLVFCQPSTYVLSAHPFLSNNVYVMYKGF